MSVKKTIAGSILFSIIISMVINTYAQSEQVKVCVNENMVSFTEAKPYINERGVTMVPLRFVSESFGAKVEWVKETSSVIITSSSSAINFNTVTGEVNVNGSKKDIKANAVVINDRTFVPLRFISEVFGKKVSWDQESSTVNILDKNLYYKKQEDMLLNFIEKRLVDKEGKIIRDLKVSENEMEALSESIGLLMEYSVLRDRKDIFDREFQFLKSKLLNKDGFIRWGLGKSQANCNAAIDDLRILKALLGAYGKWKVNDYNDTAESIQKAIFENQVKDGNLSEIYDWVSQEANDRMPLCYIDLDTITRLEAYNKAWEMVREKALEVLKNGLIDKQKPFFFKYYNYTDKQYSLDEEFAQNKGICMVYTAYSALHMAEVNQDTDVFKNWLKAEMDKGKIYAWYDPNTLKPSCDFESTAVYALAAMYSKEAGDEELYYKLVDRMLKFMVTDAKSPNYGGFGDEKTGSFNAFDSLTALNALALIDD